MKTLTQLHQEATKIVTFIMGDGSIINISATTLVTTYNKDKVHFGINYFVKVAGNNIHGNVQADSFDSVLEKLELKCEFDKATILSEVNNEPDIDIVIGC